MESPKRSRGSYRDWQDKNEPQTNKEKLRELINNSISAGMEFEQFIAAMTAAGCEVKQKKYLSFKIPGAERFIRVKSLGDDYTEQALRERCEGRRPAPKRDSSGDAAEHKTTEYVASLYRPKLLINIEAKLKQGYGAGFENYATIQNLKEAAKTLIFLKENDIGTYEELVKKDSEVSADYYRRNKHRKEIDARLAAITELQKHIGNYGKGRDIYKQYKAKKFSKKFLEEHRERLTLYKMAKTYFDGLGLEKLPSISSLKQEYATLLAEKKSLGNIKAAREDMIDWARAKHNVDIILGVNQHTKQKSHVRDER